MHNYLSWFCAFLYFTIQSHPPFQKSSVFLCLCIPDLSKFALFFGANSPHFFECLQFALAATLSVRPLVHSLLLPRNV
jgi:hypothetical protein